MKAKHQRLVLIALALGALVAAVLFAMWGLADRAAYFYTPSDIAAGKAPSGKTMRLGGMVEKGSLLRNADVVDVQFVVTDGKAATRVRYDDILPDLFREGSGVVAEGRLDASGTFVADTILAKHDENYMPPEMAGMNLSVAPAAPSAR